MRMDAANVAEDVLKTSTDRILSDLEGLEGPLLPILHALQDEFGFVPQQAVPLIAERLNLGKAEVAGVISFYHDFRAAPAGRRVLRVCRAEACQSMGGNELAQRLQERLGIGWGETTPDGAVTLEPVYCLGLCACAPAVQVDGDLLGRADIDRIETILSEAAR
ncbi:formate dehydrogenase subunit gamma [Lutimaribacter sp. EGI FJ00015]|uniref:Formate dehydrogenase subunit gamma n=1 Tax=Lutimaribacter degradans TaxID=2945989 RepID=A0ACC5ZZE0_9RHOB|nr:formate dehydrogenase subunit gamma [Lutimaribacter sp. EGI FJ00013]MCM2563563.1 formate dehydrogenase subunit gamma [Lutimaribacter sp. EGI FJ00013]MCO0614774.1 formate dehydrogenase subunit gamma [Lutimaribacter sp. EGI FJ00015]MCO0637443.1 formate dehydrogenase subunit gamma [Lutimaribacter sp. EGI FJ00014]